MKKTGNKSKKTALLIEMPNQLWEQLRWLSFNTKTSMAEIARTSIERTIKENLKKIPPLPES